MRRTAKDALLFVVGFVLTAFVAWLALEGGRTLFKLLLWLKL